MKKIVFIVILVLLFQSVTMYSANEGDYYQEAEALYEM